ncbi:MAG: aminotransferase class V-fold PLP-dependent enzyme [Synergistaceae bacterium]|nr:aminotransferase class V-fold PLP-dependent enzyme [Synergistaceae bacterium]
MAKTYMFIPGPVMVKDNVRQALLHYDICHRSPEFEEMFADTQEKIKSLFKADDSYYSIIVSGSGTSANETALSSLFKEGEEIMLIRNGVFGERLLEIIDKYKIPLVDVPFEWAEYPDVDKIEKVLAANPKVKVVAMVYHETSTGMVNPVKEVGALCEKYNKWFYVDSVSAAGGEFVNVVDNKITITSSVGGKCVGAFPGSAYICAKREVFEQVTPEMGKNVYLNLGKHYASAKKSHQTPNTPNVTLFWALNQALTNITDETLEKRVARYQACAKKLRDGMKALGLKFLLEDHMSNTVTSVFLPQGTDLGKFIGDMEKHGYTVYKGKGKYEAMGMFQVANMGEIYEPDCDKFLKALAECIK